MRDRAASTGHGPAVRSPGFTFVVLLGVVSLFADTTYEGARSILGPFLAILGASGTAVGVVVGFGELVGHGLRVVSGYVSDRTGRYWAVTIGGYALNLVAVPLLALAGSWPVAALLVVAERAGKAIRTPARDAMLSHAAAGVGAGRAFGLHEALDQIGAVIGPLALVALLLYRQSYRFAFAVLLVPALVALATLLYARRLYPEPRRLEADRAHARRPGGTLPRALWLYLIPVSLLAAGYADFPLIAYHFERRGLLPAQTIAALYALAMGGDAVAALVFGRLFDRVGPRILSLSAIISSTFAPLAFLGGTPLAVAGALVWGMGMGAQESVLRASVSTLVPADRRGSAFGFFNAAYGLAWFAGSGLLGFLYDLSVPALIAASSGAQLLSALLFLRTARAFNAAPTSSPSPGAPGGP